MAVLILSNQVIADEIACTPDLEGGVGSTMLGTPLKLADGRLAYVHPWNEVTIDWLSSYTQNTTGAEILEADVLPYPVKETLGS